MSNDIHESFDQFVAEKYNGTLLNKVKNSLGLNVPEVKKYAKMLDAASEELAKNPRIFQRMAVEQHPSNHNTPKQQAYGRLLDNEKHDAKHLFKLLRAIDEISETITDVKALTGARTNIKYALHTLKDRLLFEKDGAKLVGVYDEVFAGNPNYYAHWGYVGPDGMLATGQTIVATIIDNLKELFKTGGSAA